MRLQDTPNWYPVRRPEEEVQEIQNAGRKIENVEKAREYLESLKEDFKLLGGGEIPKYSPEFRLTEEERRTNPFYDDPASPWANPSSRPPTPEAVPVGMTTLPGGPKFMLVLKKQSKAEHEKYIHDLELREQAIKLAIAEEKLRTREEALGIERNRDQTQALALSQNGDAGCNNIILNDEIKRIKTLDDEHFLEEAEKSGKVLELKAQILERDGQGIDYELKLPNHEGSVLHLAAQFGHSSTISYLLKRDATINLLNRDGKTPLEVAVEADQEAAVTELLSNGASIEDSGQHRYLHRAKSMSVVDRLLRMGVPINDADEDGMTALHVAVGSGGKDVVEALLSWKQQPVKVDAQDCDGWTPLHYAAESGDTSIIDALLRRNPDLTICDQWGKTALEIAFEEPEENERAVMSLFEAYSRNSNADLGPWATKLVISATTSSDVKLLKSLLRYKPNLDARTVSGGTALHEAAENNNIGIVKLLLDHGASPDLADGDGKTPLYLAECKGNAAVAKMLIEKGAKHLQRPRTPPEGPDAPCIFHRLSDGKKFIRTPLGTFSIEDGMESRISNGTSTTQHQSAAKTPREKSAIRETLEKLTAIRHGPYAHALLNAAMRGHLRVIEALIYGGADVNHKDELGLTALHGAAACGQLDAIRVLHQAKADVNVRSNAGWTPLYLAACEGQVATIKLLIKLGASMDPVAEDGRTPLWAAASGGHLDAVKAILRAGKKVDKSEAERAIDEAVKVAEKKWNRLVEGGVDVAVTARLADGEGQGRAPEVAGFGHEINLLVDDAEAANHPETHSVNTDDTEERKARARRSARIHRYGKVTSAEAEMSKIFEEAVGGALLEELNLAVAKENRKESPVEGKEKNSSEKKRERSHRWSICHKLFHRRKELK